MDNNINHLGGVMNLKQAYRIELHDIKGKKKAVLIQYIQSDNMDNAIKLAKNTFHSRLYGFKNNNNGSISQKCCNLTKVSESLKFGFNAGWTTIHGNNNKDIFTMLNEANISNFVKGKSITEIYALYVNNERIN